MLTSVEACLEQGVRVGAHPSYPDREGFGRRAVGLDVDGIVATVLDQVATLEALARRAGGTVASVKPHGQLYHDLSRDPALGEAVLGALAVSGVDEVVLAAGSPAASRAVALGLVVATEGFCDRRYDDAGHLVDRAEPGAVLEDPVEAATQALALVREGIRTTDGVHPVTSLCVHSDSPGASAILAAVRAALDEVSGIVLPGR